MGLFDKFKKTATPSIEDLSDKQIREVLKKGKAPQYSPKEIRKMKETERRALLGERGLGALRSAMQDLDRDRQNRFNQLERDLLKGKPHTVERMKAEDPKRYQKLVADEAKRQGLV